MTQTNAQASPATLTESLVTRGGLKLLIEKRAQDRQNSLLLRIQSPKRCVLHWGLRLPEQRDWHLAPPEFRPPGTTVAGANAMQTPFAQQSGEGQITIPLDPAGAFVLLEFVLYFPDEGKWDNNGRQNYQIALPTGKPAGLSPLAALKEGVGPAEVLMERVLNLEDAKHLAVAVVKSKGVYRVLLCSDVPGPLALHWGISRRSPHEWLQPPETARPEGTILWEGHTAQTPFVLQEGCNRLVLSFPEGEAPLGVQFVLKKGADGAWLKQRGGNFYVPIHTPQRPGQAVDSAELAELADRIIRSEMSPSSWTLMHRFNLCYDLLEAVRGNVDGLALLYVWLRFSAIRQLTWQRNYNTKPRELAHAQDRLTGKLADLYRTESNGRALIRLMLATVGRGGDGQRIRDEILQIMHRHHVKEVGGHFLEEWHQKLHNNTTADDIVICEAYLEFLRSNGNLDAFYQALQRGGVTRERLESFERPIRTRPDFVPHLKDALLGDFGNFLKTLKAVHSSTDLETAIQAARDGLDADTQGLLWNLWNHRHDPPAGLVPLVRQITAARHRISHRLHGGEVPRSLLYLDLALEQLVRVVVERNLHQHLSGDQLVDLIGCVLENVTLSYEEAELAACLRHWERLQPLRRFDVPWALHANSVVDRIGRALSDWTDRFYQLLQPKAELLGNGFHAESWTITLFSEEVVRGSSLGFVLSMVLHQLGHVLRQAAHLGDWQIISRGRGSGTVEIVKSLRSVQGHHFEGPTVVVTDKVMGDEEIPQEVVAVIAPDVTDLVSHVAVRARNAQVLFASCSDAGTLEKLKALRGHRLHLDVTAAGEVRFAEAAESTSATIRPETRSAPGRMPRPKFERFAVVRADFNEQIVGGKSCAQARLVGKLPEWIHQPPSVALPFGACEKVLSLEANREVAQRFVELENSYKENGQADLLLGLRETVQSLLAPEELKQGLREAFAQEGLPWPDDWDAAWRGIKQVWASKWNERAALSRKRMGIADEDLFMAVLVQPVVEADYGFVIHTTNPSNGNQDELYAEVVLGLGETLVGNYPGRALSFVWDKKKEEARLLTYPGKSLGLYGGGLIFRSDSNGEDLRGYAGAGLYDSVLLHPPREARLDYADEPLVWDESFRAALLRTIAKLGLTVEAALGSAQDIEGVVAKGEFHLVQARPQV